MTQVTAGAIGTEGRRVPVAGPSITDLELAYVAEAARTNWYDNAGDFIGRFERAFAERVERAHAVSLPSCTAGLHLALLALGVGPGDEVIVPDATWIASAAAVEYVGATTVFADVDPLTWCLDVGSAAGLVNERTKAIIPVDLYGGMPDMDALAQLSAATGVAVVEDSAEAVGSAFGGRPAGSFGRVSAFSFHGSKTLTTGEGGMLVTDDRDLYDRVLVLRDHGRRPGDSTFTNHEVAYKYKMSALQAALGLAQTERLEELVAAKRQIFAWYQERLAAVPGVVLNAEPEGTRNSYWMVTVLVDRGYALHKEQLRAALAERGVDSRPFFHPLSSLQAYAGAPDAPRARERNTVSYDIAPRGVNLPSALALEEGDVDRVCTALRDVLATR